jgi:hypothetical protein
MVDRLEEGFDELLVGLLILDLLEAGMNGVPRRRHENVHVFGSNHDLPVCESERHTPLTGDRRGWHGRHPADFLPAGQAVL